MVMPYILEGLDAHVNDHYLGRQGKTQGEVTQSIACADNRYRKPS